MPHSSLRTSAASRRLAGALALLLTATACGAEAGPSTPPSTSLPVPVSIVPAAIVTDAERRLAAGDLPGVLELLEERDPASLTPRAQLLLAVSLHKSKRYGAAEPLYAAAFEREPRPAGAAGWIHMHAQCLLQLGELERARARFEEHAALDPDEGDTPLGLGRIALAEGRIDDARANFERSAELHRRTTESGRADRREEEGRALAWLGDAHLAADDAPAARAALERSVQRFPYSRGAWTKLHDVCAALGDQAGAARASTARDELDRLRAEARAAGEQGSATPDDGSGNGDG